MALNLGWNLHCFGHFMAVLQAQGSEEMRKARSLPLYLRFKTLSPLGWYIVSSWVEKRRYRALFGSAQFGGGASWRGGGGSGYFLFSRNLKSFSVHLRI